MKLSKYVFVIVLLGLFGCSDNEVTGDLNINFKLQYDGTPVVMFEDYEYPDGQDFFFTRFSFFMSDVDLGNGIIDQVHFINPTNAHNTMADAMEGYDIVIPNMAAGDYSKFSFKVGVPSDINATTPADYTSDNNLSVSSEYWPPWSSYIFAKTEAKLDNDGDGINETNVALHTGSDQALKLVSLDANYTISADGEGQINIIIDLKKVFEGSTGVYDILANPTIHLLSQNEAMLEIADNVSGAFE